MAAGSRITEKIFFTSFPDIEIKYPLNIFSSSGINYLLTTYTIAILISLTHLRFYKHYCAVQDFLILWGDKGWGRKPMCIFILETDHIDI